jgi:hypothetical protein
MPIFDQRKCQARFIIGGFEWAARGGAKIPVWIVPFQA